MRMHVKTGGRRTTRSIRAVLTLAGLVSWAAPSFAAAPSEAALSGKVMVSEGGAAKPADGATVFIGQGIAIESGLAGIDTVYGRALFRRLTTDPNGQFAAPVPPGSYAVIAWKQGLTPHTQPAVVAPGAVTLTLTKADACPHAQVMVAAPTKEPLPAPAQPVTGMNGQVTVLEGGDIKPAENATICIGQNLFLECGTEGDTLKGEAFFLKVSTDRNGLFSVPGLPPGNYSVTAWKLGLTPQTVAAAAPGVAVLHLTPKDILPHLVLEVRAPTKEPLPEPIPPATGIAGKVTLSDGGMTRRGAGLTVYVGRGLRVDPARGRGAMDTLLGEELFCKVTTDAHGLFAAPKLPPGDYDVAGWARAYVPHTVTVKAPGGVAAIHLSRAADAPAHLDLEVRVQEKGPPLVPDVPGMGIAGLVMQPDGRGGREPAAQATVCVGQGLDLKVDVSGIDTLTGGALFRKVTTNAKGQFMVRVPPGLYAVTAWKAGLTPHTLPQAAAPGIALLDLAKADLPPHRILEIRAATKSLPGSCPFEGVWKDTVTRHEACSRLTGECKDYTSDLLFTTGADGVTTVTWDNGAGVGKGKMVSDQTLTFDYNVVRGEPRGRVSLTLSEDGLGFAGTFSHKSGHRGTMTGSYRAEVPEPPPPPPTKEKLDLHVVLTWSRPCDLDLHVTEPGGEECYFSHRTTASGAYLDRDDREGTGPENYCVEEKPLKGEYKIGVCFYSDKGTPGPVTATVRIYRDYQRLTQQLLGTFNVTMPRADTIRIYPVASVFMPEFRVVGR